MAANEDALGALHSKVAETLSVMLDGTELPTGEEDAEGNAIVQVLLPSAAVLTASIQFLKNNNITCVASDENALGALAEKQRKIREGRRANVVDFGAAREQQRFSSGLPD